jgi:hypothetical protein
MNPGGATALPGKVHFMSDLYFDHGVGAPPLSGDVTVTQSGSNCVITVTLHSTASADGQLVMWYADPCNPKFNSNLAQPLLPVPGVGNVGIAQGATPSNTTLFLPATPSSPAVFSLEWAIPSTVTNPAVGFFFQAVDQSDQGAPRSFVPGAQLNAQQNFSLTLPAFRPGLAARAPDSHP